MVDIGGRRLHLICEGPKGSTPEVHRAMRGQKADFGAVIEATRLVSREPAVSLKLATVVSRVNRENLPEPADRSCDNQHRA